ncbi:MAG: RHS repeat-associated core domain-containing protein, partial [Anaerolineae bacterium]|nr:RHS repeat-associated core domain-containing protein [Anaerolineae bacterium]
LYFVLKDKLGSANVITDASGATVGEARYYPYGETRLTTGTLYTDKLFTGQREMAGLGIYHYGARFYSPKLGRFLSADTIVPSYVNPQNWNRFSYVGNNPINFVDPTGHVACSRVAEEDCSFETMSPEEVVKRNIKVKYNITMSDKGGKKWSLKNLRTVYASLQNMDNALNGQLKEIAGGATFQMAEYQPTAKCSSCTYGGWTSGTTITFYTMGDAAIRQMNIYHEFGHLIDSQPGEMYDVFTNALEGQGSPGYVGSDGYLNPDALISGSITNDLNYASVQAIQASNNTPAEQWADMFANFVAGNINLAKSEGMIMNNFINKVLAPYAGFSLPPTPIKDPR